MRIRATRSRPDHRGGSHAWRAAVGLIAAAILLGPAVVWGQVTTITGNLYIGAGSTAESWSGDAFISSGSTLRTVAGNLSLAGSGSGPCAGLPAGTSCTDTNPGDCNRAACDGSGLCQQDYGAEAAGYVCRAQNGACDVAETCSGALGACPTNLYAADGSAGAPSCAPYTCPGTGPACLTTCAGSGDCVTGSTCSGGACVVTCNGNGVVEGAELCDQGAANGTTGSCCTASCTFVAAGTVCDGLSGATCAGSAATCPTWRYFEADVVTCP